jgi:hypothetical protein
VCCEVHLGFIDAFTIVLGGVGLPVGSEFDRQDWCRSCAAICAPSPDPAFPVPDQDPSPVAETPLTRTATCGRVSWHRSEPATGIQQNEVIRLSGSERAGSRYAYKNFPIQPIDDCANLQAIPALLDAASTNKLQSSCRCGSALHMPPARPEPLCRGILVHWFCCLRIFLFFCM